MPAIGMLLLVVAAFIAGALWRGAGHPAVAATDDDTAAQAEQAKVWTCSMHPQIKLPKQGQCPICFMDLIPLDSGAEDDTALRSTAQAKQQSEADGEKV